MWRRATPPASTARSSRYRRKPARPLKATAPKRTLRVQIPKLWPTSCICSNRGGTKHDNRGHRSYYAGGGRRSTRCSNRYKFGRRGKITFAFRRRPRYHLARIWPTVSQYSCRSVDTCLACCPDHGLMAGERGSRLDGGVSDYRRILLALASVDRAFNWVEDPILFSIGVGPPNRQDFRRKLTRW